MAVDNKQRMAVGDSGIGQCKIWIFFDGLIEVLNAVSQILFGALAPVEATFPVELISFITFRVVFTYSLLITRHLQPKLIYNLDCHLSLCGHQLRRFAIIPLAPKQL